MATMRHTILVVDDEPEVVRSVGDLLRMDYRVLGASRASEGLELLGRENVHVVMSDQRMPEMTGVQFLNLVRDMHPDIVRLLFTGYADVRAVIDAINHGNVYRYVTKPWEPDELESVIRDAVQLYDLVDERNRLLGELRTKNVELESTLAELEHATALKSDFIRVASHELRTPLTVVAGMLELLEREPAARKPPLDSFIDRTTSGVRRLCRVVDQLTAMLVAGDFERHLETEPADVVELVRAAVDDVVPFIALRQQHLALAPTDVPITLEVDTSKIRDAVTHLLLNAIRFTPDGEEIRVSVVREGDGGVAISVEDTGPGIEPRKRPHLFEPFYTGFPAEHHSSGVYEHRSRGLGLGLSVARAFVEMHGGRIDLESEVGRGSTFMIRLPEPRPDADGAGKI